MVLFDISPAVIRIIFSETASPVTGLFTVFEAGAVVRARVTGFEDFTDEKEQKKETDGKTDHSGRG